MKRHEVVAAIIMHEDQILCMQRDKSKYEYISYKYEFPGGKIETGETKAKALQRELQEEMALEVEITEKDYYMSVDHIYPDFAITMHSFLCRVSHKNFERKEHAGHKWLPKEALMSLDWAAADIPIVKRLQEGDQ